MKHWLIYFFFSAAIIIIYGCTQSKYAVTNKKYKKQAKVFAKIIRSNPAATDSGFQIARDWVGTINFNLRKPGFVIIHHTAQNNCGQTLKHLRQKNRR